MNVIANFSNQKDILLKKEGEKVFCTVNGTLQEVVYTKYNDNQESFYENVRTTKQERLRLQQALTSTVSTIQPVLESGVNIYSKYNFDYGSGIIDKFKNVVTWQSSVDNLYFEQTTVPNQPQLGVDARGVNGYSPIHFKAQNSEFMSLNSPISLSGDFTMFIYAEPIPIVPKAYKKMRLLGNSLDNKIYLSIGEAITESYNMSFASGSEIVVSATGGWQPISKRLLITIQRNGSTFYIRENGVQVATGTIPTSNFVFDQVGKIGTDTDTYNGSIYHLSAYSGYITSTLENLEKSIIKQASLAKEQ